MVSVGEGRSIEIHSRQGTPWAFRSTVLLSYCKIQCLGNQYRLWTGEQWLIMAIVVSTPARLQDEASQSLGRWSHLELGKEG